MTVVSIDSGDFLPGDQVAESLGTSSDDPSESRNCKVPNCGLVVFHISRQVSPSSSLIAKVLSGAICWISGPVGTLNPKVDEYANLQYLASVALMGQGQNCPKERR